MSEADWWVCDACRSLNNLSARRCYSCHRRKPKHALRASQQLGFISYVTWDGKVHFEPAPPDLAELEKLARETRRPPRIRDPQPRSVLEVAPAFPLGTRITYRLGDPRGDPDRRPARPTPPLPRPIVAVPIEPELEREAPWPAPVRVQQEREALWPESVRAERGWIATDPEALRPEWVRVESPRQADRPADLRPTSGPPEDRGDTLFEEPPEGGWPHWRELLDVPRPDPARLRRSLGTSETGSSALRRATRGVLRRAMEGRSGAFHAHGPQAPWPAEDLAAKRRGEPSS
jgi:hypothetical protein